jgi:hypothetical protein
MSEDKPGYTVRDRRHSSESGAARAPEVRASETTRDAAAAPKADAPQADQPVSFMGFLLSLGAQALALLGAGQADSEEADRESDLHGAQQIISILEMLRDKTEGRRTTDEERVLEDLLFQLRMSYVQRRQGGGA